MFCKEKPILPGQNFPQKLRWIIIKWRRWQKIPLIVALERGLQYEMIFTVWRTISKGGDKMTEYHDSYANEVSLNI